jgi:hypothetical protein
MVAGSPGQGMLHSDSSPKTPSLLVTSEISPQSTIRNQSPAWNQFGKSLTTLLAVLHLKKMCIGLTLEGVECHFTIAYLDTRCRETGSGALGYACQSGVTCWRDTFVREHFGGRRFAKMVLHISTIVTRRLVPTAGSPCIATGQANRSWVELEREVPL